MLNRASLRFCAGQPIRPARAGRGHELRGPCGPESTDERAQMHGVAAPGRSRARCTAARSPRSRQRRRPRHSGTARGSGDGPRRSSAAARRDSSERAGWRAGHGPTVRCGPPTRRQQDPALLRGDRFLRCDDAHAWQRTGLVRARKVTQVPRPAGRRAAANKSVPMVRGPRSASRGIRLRGARAAGPLPRVFRGPLI